MMIVEMILSKLGTKIDTETKGALLCAPMQTETKLKFDLVYAHLHR